jgi:hypothetical protein
MENANCPERPIDPPEPDKAHSDYCEALEKWEEDVEENYQNYWKEYTKLNDIVECILPWSPTGAIVAKAMRMIGNGKAGLVKRLLICLVIPFLALANRKELMKTKWLKGKSHIIKAYAKMPYGFGVWFRMSMKPYSEWDANSLEKTLSKANLAYDEDDLKEIVTGNHDDEMRDDYEENSDDRPVSPEESRAAYEDTLYDRMVESKAS